LSAGVDITEKLAVATAGNRFCGLEIMQKLLVTEEDSIKVCEKAMEFHWGDNYKRVVVNV
jgi:hypothetical protein